MVIKTINFVCVCCLASAVLCCTKLCEPRQQQPAPPPPPPPPPPAPVPVKAQNTDTMKSTKSNMSTTTQLHEELLVVLPQIQERRNKLLDFKKTPDIFIHQKSNPEEVVDWLEAKGFSSNAQRQLKIAGHQLFSLSRGQLETALGPDEGKRLYSQILVQRNVSGYKTTTSSELQSILRKAREKVEVS